MPPVLLNVTEDEKTPIEKLRIGGEVAGKHVTMRFDSPAIGPP